MHRICFFEQIKLRHSILNHGILNECLTKIILIDLNETRTQDYGKEKVEEIKAKTEYADKLQIIFDTAKANNFQLYLIIDEYDNFTNVVLTDYYYDMAYDGIWEEGLRFMADAYAKVSSVRDGIESERNLQGFFMAYLNLNDYYIMAPRCTVSLCSSRDGNWRGWRKCKARCRTLFQLCIDSFYWTAIITYL